MAPTLRTLARIDGIKLESLSLVRQLLTLPEGADTLRAFVEAHCPNTLGWIHSCYHNPLESSQDSRREVQLEAANELLGGSGVEACERPGHVIDHYWREHNLF